MADLTITKYEAPELAEAFKGPLSIYFTGLTSYFIHEEAAYSVTVNLAELPGFNRTWEIAAREKLNQIRAARELEEAWEIQAEREAERRNEEILGGFGHYEEEYFGFGYL